MRLLSAVLLASVALSAQKLDPVQWKAEAPLAAAPGSTVLIKVTATIEPGWHLYSLTTPRPSIPTTLTFADNPVFANADAFQLKPDLKVDPNGARAEQFTDRADFYLKATLKPDAPAGVATVAVQVRYAACDDKQCLPPKKKTAEFSLNVAVGTPASPSDPPAGYTAGTGRTELTAPAEKPAEKPTEKPAEKDMPQGLAQFLLVAFGFGLATIFTPCVFPMIPITMSFFLNQPQSTRAQQVKQAIIFCLGIVVLFTGLGLAITALLGSSGVKQFASNPWINGFIGLIFLALGLSLLGAFELTLPSGLLTKLNSASSGGGTLSTLLMGLTFALTSFACVGPFMGAILAASVTGDKLQPTLGMASFASGLASPFFFLALFPGVLAKMPRAGAWMVRIKVVFGFVVLALMFKYLSNIDVVLQLNLLPRERFLAIWFVLFALPGLYLLGFLRMEGINKDEEVGIPRLLAGIVFLVFSFNLLPGMFGGNLGDLESYVPLAKESAGSGSASASGLTWMKNDLAGALAKAKAENKAVFVNFTGYACTNCHWMKANMFTRPDVNAAMREMVLVELYTDGTTAEDEANQKLQETKYQTVAIPYYLILNAEEKVLAAYPGLTKDPAAWLKFLSAGKI
ncbi:MAG: thioredoxin family protein [Bryobacteraceae bacterium]|nr:thioredoxin family protein [Bryobacteraceae bacterium]